LISNSNGAAAFFISTGNNQILNINAHHYLTVAVERPFQDQETRRENPQEYEDNCCFLPPSLSLPQAITALEGIAEDPPENRPAVIAGDFNAWATEWGSPRTNARGKALLQSFAALDLVLLNFGTKPIFSTAGTSSIIDLTFVNTGLASGSSWEVSDTYTGSDHAAIICTINSRIGPPRVPKTVPGYKIETLDVEMVQMLFNDLSTSG